MTNLVPYLLFAGTCREAMNFYKDCLGGELTLHTFETAPMADNMPEEAQKMIMHAILKSDVLTLMASDNGGMTPAPVNGDSISLSMNCNSDEEVTSLFDKLSEGGKVKMPLADQFWGAKFGMLTDKFGMHWMLNYDKPQQG